MLALHIKADKLPEPVREFEFHPLRGWRFDFAWPAIKFAVEVDGEVHRIKERFHADIEKRAVALLNGWDVLHVGGREVRSGQAIAWLKALLWERT
jgi:very-short-patch-repair endonuclease